MSITTIVDSIDKTILNNGLQSVSDRYYDHKYCIKIDGVKDPVDQRVSFHTNKICMLSLAENHPIIKNKLAIKKINFEIDGKVDRSKNAASGKGKRGAQKLNPNSVICYVETDVDIYPVYSCIKGKLIEINEALLENSNLIIDKPVSDGYIALLLPILKEYAICKESMLTKDQYISAS